MFNEILSILAIPFLIYVFWSVRKMEKESKKRWKELAKVYGVEMPKENEA